MKIVKNGVLVDYALPIKSVPFEGATAEIEGKSGDVPKPGSGDQEKFLKGDGTWGVPVDTDTKVTNVLNTDTKAYITGTINSETNTGTQIFDTGVYLDDAAGSLTATGDITGARVFNAVYNDYAEFFPRGEATEPGDIVMLDMNSDKEQYVKAYRTNKVNSVIGIHSNEFGHLIGGENPPDGSNYLDHNIKKYIPVGLAGRCMAKIIGPAIKGAPVYLSNMPGVGICLQNHIPDENPVGYLVEADNINDNKTIRLLRIKLR